MVRAAFSKRLNRETLVSNHLLSCNPFFCKILSPTKPFLLRKRRREKILIRRCASLPLFHSCNSITQQQQFLFDFVFFSKSLLIVFQKQHPDDQLLMIFLKRKAFLVRLLCLAHVVGMGFTRGKLMEMWGFSKTYIDSWLNSPFGKKKNVVWNPLIVFGTLDTEVLAYKRILCFETVKKVLPHK